MAFRSRRPQPVRVRRNWKTYDLTDGPVRDVRGWDATALAAIDGGGLTTWGRGFVDGVEVTGEPSDTAPTDGRRRRSRKAGRR